MKVLREMGPEDGSWTNTFMGNDDVPFRLNSLGIVAALSPARTAVKTPISPSSWTTLTPPTNFAEKMGCIIRENPAWACTSSLTPRASGLRFCLPTNAESTTE